MAAREGEGVLAADELHLASVIRTKAKTRGFAFAPMARRRPGVRSVVAVLLDNNALEEWELTTMNDHETGEFSMEISVEPTKSRALKPQAIAQMFVRSRCLQTTQRRDVFPKRFEGMGSRTRGACLR